MIPSPPLPMPKDWNYMSYGHTQRKKEARCGQYFKNDHNSEYDEIFERISICSESVSFGISNLIRF